MHTTTNTDFLTRSNVWSSQLKEVLLEDLMGMQYVNWINDGEGSGTTVNIPSIGQGQAYDYDENQAVKYTSLDTGNFTFVPNKYLASGNYITNKAKQDFFYMSQLVSKFVPAQRRAIEVQMETDLLKIGPTSQTASDLNLINGARHRYVAAGTNEVITLRDFAYAKYALKKANVPMTGLTAIVDSSCEVELNKLAASQGFINNPRWEGIVNTGFATGMKFLVNIFGFDVYVSDHLHQNVASETVNSVTVTAGVNNLFFSADSTVTPFVGKIVQPPKVDGSYNKDFQRDEYVTTCRYGFGFYRPENLVVVLTDTDQVYA